MCPLSELSNEVMGQILLMPILCRKLLERILECSLRRFTHDLRLVFKARAIDLNALKEKDFVRTLLRFKFKSVLPTSLGIVCLCSCLDRKSFVYFLY